MKKPLKMNLQFFSEGAPPPQDAGVPPTAPTTQSTAGNVDYSAIIETAAQKAAAETEKKFDGVLKSMIKQQAPQTDEETIKAMVADYKSKQVTPEKEIQTRDETIKTLQATIEAEQQKNTAMLKGVPLSDEAQAEKVNACLTLAKSYVSDTVTFEQALDKAMNVISFTAAEEQKPSGFQVSAGASNTGTNADVERLKAEYATAAKNKDTAKMSLITRQAQEKKIRLN